MSTIVSGILRDSSGQLWTNAPVQLIFQVTPGAAGPFVWSGGAFNGKPPIVISDPLTAAFTITVPANNEIIPANSYWQIIIGPGATFPAFVLNVHLITGSLDISTLFGAQASLGFTQSMAVPRAYADTEVIVPPNSGQLYYDVTNKALKFFENGIWNALATGGGAPVMVYPAAGIGVSTGTAWGTSIDPATVPRTNVANTFTVSPQTIHGQLTVVSPNGTVNGTLDCVTSPPHQNTRWVGVNNSSTTIPAGFQIEGYSSDYSHGGQWLLCVTDIANPYVQIPQANFIVGGVSGGDITATGTITAGNGIFNGAVNMAHLNVLSGAGDKAAIGVGSSTVFFESFGVDTSTMGIFKFRSEHSDGSNYADVVTIDGGGNAYFNGNTTIQGKAIIGGNAIRIGNRSTPSEWLTGSPSISCDPQNVVVNASAGGSVLFNWDKGTGGVLFGNGTQTNTQCASIDAGGNAAFSGSVAASTTIWATKHISAGESVFPITGSQVSAYRTVLSNNGIWSVLTCAGDGGTRGQLIIGGIDPGGSQGWLEYAEFSPSGLTLNGVLNSQHCILIGTSDGVQFNVTGSTPTYAGKFRIWGQGSDGSNGRYYLDIYSDSTGVHSHFDSDLSCSGTKSFKITNPLDEKSYLIHACLEGPENGVYYRGEASTDAGGQVLLFLPDYFEALTFIEDRSVQLTVIDDGSMNFPLLKATTVRSNSFVVYSSISNTKFYWEVKAVRKIGVSRLEVVREKEIKPKGE